MCLVAYDEKLASRIRELVGNDPDCMEKKMFGGLAFVVNGNMAVAASGQGGLLVRVDPDDSARFAEENGARFFEMRGREMPGWLRVDGEAVQRKADLARWVKRGVSYARSLPPKP
jgi:TfoX/Sxy family transcriptional regulator of competence genes